MAWPLICQYLSHDRFLRSAISALSISKVSPSNLVGDPSVEYICLFNAQPLNKRETLTRFDDASESGRAISWLPSLVLEHIEDFASNSSFIFHSGLGGPRGISALVRRETSIFSRTRGITCTSSYLPSALCHLIPYLQLQASQRARDSC